MEAVLRALADESRRTVLETLANGPATAGELAALLPIARPGVSRHLRVLREAGLVEVRQEAQRRVYSLRPEPLAEVDEWLGRYRALWEQRLDALHTEVARGKRERTKEHLMTSNARWRRTHPGQPAISRWRGCCAHRRPLRHRHRRPVVGLTDPARLARWYGEVEGDLRLGGEFRVYFAADARAPGAWTPASRHGGCG